MKYLSCHEAAAIRSPVDRNLQRVCPWIARRRDPLHADSRQLVHPLARTAANLQPARVAGEMAGRRDHRPNRDRSGRETDHAKETPNSRCRRGTPCSKHSLGRNRRRRDLKTCRRALDRARVSKSGVCRRPRLQLVAVAGATLFPGRIERGCHYEAHQSVSRLDSSYSWNKEYRQLSQWLQGLAKPVGIMACYDIKAQQILDVCRELDLAVPEQVAVIGADNDDLLCNLSDPPLTSVIPNSHRAGYEAARLLDRMMSGQEVQNDGVLVRPLGIHTRQSTDTLAIEDADIAAAVRFIRQHATEGIQVGDVLKAVPLSRRVLESRFRKILGRTPHEEIVRQRISRVQQLLSETELSLREIAERSGFEHPEYLSVCFKQATGQSPSQFRKASVSGEA